MKEHTIIIGAGPCGLACALALKEKGINPLIIEKGNIVQTIYNFPTHQTFFSTSKLLEIGNMPFVSANPKPKRMEALAYYREVVLRNELRIHPYETVLDVQQVTTDEKIILTKKNGEHKQYKAKNIIIATGYYDQPQYMHIPGEHLQKVSHYFKEAHPYYGCDVAIIGGKNSAVDAALELVHAGANITVLYRGAEYSKSIKPWILPEFAANVRKGKINMVFNAQVTEIREDTIVYQHSGEEIALKNDFVFAMTGYQPNIRFLQQIGIHIDEDTGRPKMNEQTYETNLANIYVAGVIISGFNGNETFIENGRLHAEPIATAIVNKT